MTDSDTNSIRRWATVVESPRRVGDRWTLHVTLDQPWTDESVGGRFFMTRCGIEDDTTDSHAWNYYAGCPVYAITLQPAAHNDQPSQESTDSARPCARWHWLLPAPTDPSLPWLLARRPGDRILVYGPYGNPFSVPAPATRRNLVVIADSARLLALLSPIHEFLDHGGRVSVLVLPGLDGVNHTAALVHALAIQVELQFLEAGSNDPAFIDGVRWADTALFAVDAAQLYQMAYKMRNARFQTSIAGSSNVQDEFAYALVEADLLCGYGACLACSVPTAGGGVTRACIHGPIFPLSRLVGP
ncbi:MAG: hypothetical protein WDZ49_16265 [Litorilinea sp.]